MPLPPGSKLGPYEILAPLGAGGMGEVYRARDTRLDRSVSIKILSTHFPDDPTHRHCHFSLLSFPLRDTYRKRTDSAQLPVNDFRNRNLFRA
jgi:serine/threonine protein kinase